LWIACRRGREWREGGREGGREGVYYVFVEEGRKEGGKEGVSTRCTLRKRGGRSGFRKR